MRDSGESQDLQGSTQHILVNILEMKRVNVGLVSKDLNLLQKRRR